MAYQALYRQWRPKDFSHMVGQETIVATLRNQIRTGRIAHAYLFCGSRGTGKTSTAKILARAINCLHPRDGDPCGECENCRRMEAEESLDVIEIDAASNNGVDEIRNLRDTVKYPPQFGQYKVYIIDEVHMLSVSAFNALLKTLEEPPEHVVFILATTEPQKLPATVLSRCQRFDFGRISAAKIQARLREAAEGAGGKATDGALNAIARAAEGGMRDALSILDMCLGYGKDINEELVRTVLGTSDRAFLFRFSQALREEDPAQVILLIDEVMRDGKDPLVFSRDVSGHLRTLLMAKCCGAESGTILEMTEEDTAEYLRESEEYPASRLMDMLELFMRLEADLRYASSPRIALESVALKCCLRTAATDTLAISDRMAELENRISQLREALERGIPERAERKPAPAAAGGAQEKTKKTAANPKTAPKKQALTPVGRGAEDSWKAAVTQLQKTEPSIHGMLNFGVFLGLEGGVFQWQANPGFEIIASSLNSPDRKARIVAALTEAAGAPCDFRAMDGTAAGRRKEEAVEADQVQELEDTFGAGAVQVVDSLPE